VVTSKVPKSLILPFHATEQNNRTELDLDACVAALQDPALSNTPAADLPGTIDAILQLASASVPAGQRKRDKKPWFDDLAYELRNRCRALALLSRRDVAFNRDFLIARSAYQSHLKRVKTGYDISQCDNLVAGTKKEGIRALYRAVKPVATTSSIPLHELATYASGLLNVPGGSTAECPKVVTCEVEKSPLLNPVTVQEVNGVLSSLRSKACSASSSISPHSLKLLSGYLAPVLVRVFNVFIGTSSFPKRWAESVIFFLHKKGSRSLTSNYRTICIENPFLKAFMSLLAQRFYRFSESNSLLPDVQFGFRQNRSCLSAASILHEIAFSRLHSKKRTYACFVDFTKAFDSVCRPLLFRKLQLIGFPHATCVLLHNIFSSLSIRVRSGSLLSPPFTTSLGTPQGDPLSPLLFSLFISDLPHSLPDSTLPLPSILFADDVALLAESASDLQASIDALQRYATEHQLQINVSKTKCLVFHRGRLPSCSFHIDGAPLEIVTSFVYLGFKFSVQLSFSSHCKSLLSKANARIGYLFKRIPLTRLPLSIVLQVFDVYILPIFLYGSHLWLSSVSRLVLLSVDSLFTKFLKRYLGLPSFIHNSIIHHLTNTSPLSNTLLLRATSSPLKAGFPESLSDTRLSFIAKLEAPPSYSPYPLIPSVFWSSPVLHCMPMNPKLRRLTLLGILGPLANPPWERDT
jgi:hypothetical protein